MDKDLDFAEPMEKDEEALRGEALECLLVQCAGLEEDIACLKRNMELLALEPESGEARGRMQEMQKEMAQLIENARERCRMEEDDADIDFIWHEIGLLALNPESGEARGRMQEMQKEMDSLEEALEGTRKELAETEKRCQEPADERAREAEASHKGENRETEEAAAGDMQEAARQQEANFRQHRRGR